MIMLLSRTSRQDTLKRWAQTKTYKLYDTSLSTQSRLFYNIKDDINEEHPIADTGAY
jgi:hypothetical protein